MTGRTRTRWLAAGACAVAVGGTFVAVQEASAATSVAVVPGTPAVAAPFSSTASCAGRSGSTYYGGVGGVNGGFGRLLLTSVGTDPARADRAVASANQITPAGPAAVIASAVCGPALS